MNSITRNTTIITGGLIFLGFCRYYFYFQTFQIEIYNYISSSELLLSFLPIIVSNFVPIALCLYFGMLNPEFEDRKINGKNFTYSYNKLEERRTPMILFKHILYSRRLNRRFRFKIFLHLLTRPLTVAFVYLICLTIQFWVMVAQNKSWLEGGGIFMLISFGWLIFLIEPFIFNTANKSSLIKNFNLVKHNVRLINYFFILLYFIFYSQKIKAWQKIGGENNESVRVILNSNDTIATTNSFVYIGQTSSYLFFRNFEDSTNQIISLSNVRDLKISTLKNIR